MKDCCQQKSCKNISNKACTIALVGNPNCGKTTIFNQLTGSTQRIGNWPGVTVEKKSGSFTYANSTIEVIDLPGLYSTLKTDSGTALDESLACDYILQKQCDLIVNIVDATNLERNLYLTTQLLEMGIPIILAINMIDVANSRGIYFDIPKLQQQLGCPIILLTAHKGHGIEELKQAVIRYELNNYTSKKIINYQIQPAINELSVVIAAENAEWLALRLLEGDVFVRQLVTNTVLETNDCLQKHIQMDMHEDADILIADNRYKFIHELIQNVVNKNKNIVTLTEKIDRVVLNRFLGLPIFLFTMYCLFLFSINIGGAFQDFFDISSQTIFVDGFANLLQQIHVPNWLTVILANGIGKGINTTITFIPVIGAMFLFLALLEDSGYMARAAFVVDRFMQTIGLPGKAFVPMIVGFGCNVPAVMGARTLEAQQDRIITIMMSPFMSCGARLAIFAVFTTAFFPHGGQNVVFALYLIGILMAVLTGFILRKTILKGDASPLVMELPPYHMPQMKTLILHAWQRLKGFVFRAGKLIVPICTLIGLLNCLNLDGTINAGDGDAHSLLSFLGQWATPIFAPMGIHQHNWPATVGLLTGVLAKEVVVGTLNTLYSQIGHFGTNAIDTFQFWPSLKEAVQSIPENFAALGHAFSNPILAKAPIHAMNQGVYGLMYQQFDGKIGAFAYLLFVLLYFPCVSTTAAMLREIHRGWAIFSIFWMTLVAYSAAVIFYQIATFTQHPMYSSIWVGSLLIIFMLTILTIKQVGKQPAMLSTGVMT